MTSSGNPRCEYCAGKGVVRTVNGWRVCTCRRGSRLSRAAARRLNSIGTRGYQSPFKDQK